MLSAPPPSPRISRQPRRQIPQRKRMTIALGILAKDGVAIAADTQESVGAYKVAARKIFSRPDPNRDRAFAVTGAGNAGYLESLGQGLARDFEQGGTMAAIENRMSANLLRFHQDHIFPRQSLPISQ